MATTQSKTNWLRPLEDLRSELYHCSDCNYCVEAVWHERGIEHVCATYEQHEATVSYTGRGYIGIARALLEGEDFAIDEISERVFSCTQCGGCERICPIGLHPKSVNLALRSALVECDGVPEIQQKRRTNLLETGNPDGHPTDERYAWIEDCALQSPALDICTHLFLPGCTASYGCPGEARAAFNIILEHYPNADVLKTNDRCCGAPLSELGFVTNAANQQTSLEQALTAFPFLERIVFLDAKCGQQMPHDPHRVTFVAWLHNEIKKNQIMLKPKEPLPTIACVSTCSSSDDNHLMADLLAHLGVSLNNTLYPSKHALCCGANGGMPAMAADSAAKMARAAIDDLCERTADEEGPAIVVTSDPNCLTHLRSQSSRADDTDQPIILGLAEFLDTYFINV